MINLEKFSKFLVLLLIFPILQAHARLQYQNLSTEEKNPCTVLIPFSELFHLYNYLSYVIHIVYLFFFKMRELWRDNVNYAEISVTEFLKYIHE